MTQTAKVVSTFSVSNDDNRPDARLVRLTAKWRQARGLDDSPENMHASSLAVLRENPKLAREYGDMPMTIARHGESHFSREGAE